MLVVLSVQDCCALVKILRVSFQSSTLAIRLQSLTGLHMLQLYRARSHGKLRPITYVIISHVKSNHLDRSRGLDLVKELLV